jgi:hypothetical protein
MKNILLMTLGLFLIIGCNTKTTNEEVKTEDVVEIIEDKVPENELEETPKVIPKDFQKDLEELKEAYQKKLDTGYGMVKTSIEYSVAIDSIVVLLYSNLSGVVAKSELEELSKDQKGWFTQRENAFQEEWKKGEAIQAETGIFPEIEQMTAYGAAFDVSYEKALELNKKLRK